MGGSTYSKPLPNINQDTRFDKEKASNLFTAMEKAIAQEQAKQGPDRLNAIDRQWESKRRPLVQNTKKKEESESSDSFELDGDTGAFTGVYTQSKANNSILNDKLVRLWTFCQTSALLGSASVLVLFKLSLYLLLAYYGWVFQVCCCPKNSSTTHHIPSNF